MTRLVNVFLWIMFSLFLVQFKVWVLPIAVSPSVLQVGSVMGLFAVDPRRKVVACILLNTLRLPPE